MFLFDLFESRSALKSSSPFRVDGGSGKPVNVDIGLERFVSQPNAVPIEISVAGLTTSDLSQ